MNAETSNDLQTELHITDHQYSVALMLFLISYALFEVPSNYFLKKLTPSVSPSPFLRARAPRPTAVVLTFCSYVEMDCLLDDEVCAHVVHIPPTDMLSV